MRTILGEGHDSLSEVRSLFAKEPLFVVVKGEIDYWRRQPEVQAVIKETIEREYRVEMEVDGIAV